MTAPVVSVCVPTFNGAAFIEETIASVLHQTLDDFELVVVDHDSTDGTPEAVSGFGDPRLRLVHNHEADGVAGNWNRAVEETRGRFVKLLCHDDTLTPDCLATQVAALDAHPGVALVAGRRHVIDEGGRILLRARGLGSLRGVVEGPRAIRAAVRAGTNLFGEPACVLMRRELIPVCGGFSDHRPYVIDLDYWCRMLRLGDLYALDRPVAAFRVTRTSWSVALARSQRAQTMALLEELAGDVAGVRRSDLVLGAARNRVLAGLRTAAYQVLSRRPATRPRDRAPAPPGPGLR